MKDTTHMLNILDSFRFSNDGGSVWCSQWTSNHCIQSFPNDESLVSLKYFLNKREVKDPPTDTLVRMAELVLTLNTFEFNGEYYKQVGGLAMSSRLGPNYARLFVGYVEERMLDEYTVTGRKPDLYKRYMDDVAGAVSNSEQDLQQFLDFPSKYHPKLVYTWSISSDKVPFLDICMTPRDYRISTSIYYRDTD